MTVDYDLIILGGTLIGREAALRASQFGARVALIESSNLPSLELNAVWNATLIELNQSLRPGLLDQLEMTRTVPINWQQICAWVQQWAETRQTSIAGTHSRSELAVAGIEVMIGEAAFRRSHSNRRAKLPLSLTVANRQLRSRAYLLALPSQPSLPTIAGIETVNSTDLMTLDSWQSAWQTLPRQVLILGTDPRGIVLAQVLNRLGVEVTLLTSQPQLVPSADPEASWLLQAHLEAEGITVLTQTLVSQMQQRAEQIWIQYNHLAETAPEPTETAAETIETETIETETIVLATQPQLNLHSLNLGAASVRWQPDQIWVNRKLQTTHPRIYACGECLGSSSLRNSNHDAATARHEAETALWNALFLPRRQVNYSPIPSAVFTDPQLVTLGLSEPQARQLYGNEVLIAKQPSSSLLKAQISNSPGFFKLIIRRNGDLLGAHALGVAASEWMPTLALAMQQRLKLNRLVQLPSLPASFANLIRTATQQLQQQQQPAWRQELLEAWFDFRRGR